MYILSKIIQNVNFFCYIYNMKKIYSIKAVDYVTQKLSAVKLVKELTGMGLKDAKGVVDTAMENYNSKNNNYSVEQEIVIDVVGDSVLTAISNLTDLGFQIGNSEREDNLTKLLTKFTVYIPSKQVKYIILEGDYEVLDKNVLKITIVEGLMIHEDRFGGDLEINNIEVDVAFTECIVEKDI